MAKRYRDTEIQDEDWYMVLNPIYKLLWDWISDKCDHAGLWRPNVVRFETFNGKVDLEKAMEFYNEPEKERLIKLENGKFFLPGFFVFQYGEKMNLNNKVHKSINQLYYKNGVKLSSIRGLKEVIEGVMDMDKEKDIDKDFIKKEKEEKIEKVKFSQYVQMTNEEYSKLVSEYGLEFSKQCITALDNYKGSSGKSYKSDYRAILSWVVDKVKEKSSKGIKPSKAAVIIEDAEWMKQQLKMQSGI